MKTATITFHGAHNYGSVLQAYALQQTIMSLGYENEIINLRTERQKDLYTVFTKRKGLKYIFKNISHLAYYFPLKKRYNKFEDFINSKLKITREYATEAELRQADMQYDTFIAGSDQIWNPIPVDFDWSYYLIFVQQGKRISYAPSFGQLSSLGDKGTEQNIADALKKFDVISVRERGSAQNIYRITGKESAIVLDPTLLVEREHWLSLVKNKKQLIKGNYIFFYTLFADPVRLSIVKKISKALNMPIVTSNFSNQYDVINPFKKLYDAGPLDFLTLIRDAKIVVVSSFHGAVFSSILNVPFFAIDGMEDARISTLLTSLGLEHRTITAANVVEKINDSNGIDFKYVNNRIRVGRKTSMDFLKQNL